MALTLYMQGLAPFNPCLTTNLVHHNRGLLASQGMCVNVPQQHECKQMVYVCTKGVIR